MEVQDNVDIRKIRIAILAGGILFSSIGLINVLIGIGLVDYQRVIQYSGGIIHQNIFSHYLLILSLFTFISYLYFKKKIYFLLMGLFLIQLFFTFSRVTIAAAAVGFSVVFLLRLPKVKSLIVSAVILGCLIYLIFGPSPIRTRMFFDTEGISVKAFISNPNEVLSRIDMKGRDKVWKYSIDNVLLPSPLKGGGLGSTNYVIEREFEIVGVMHNEYLRILVETGVIVFIIFTIAYLKFLRDMFVIFKKSQKRSQANMFALLGFVSVVCYFVVAITSNVFDSYSQFSMYVFCFLGLAYRSFEIENERSSEVTPGG
jgi:O-antigen ligase